MIGLTEYINNLKAKNEQLKKDVSTWKYQAQMHADAYSDIKGDLEADIKKLKDENIRLKGIKDVREERDSLKAQLSELQPYERGAIGWGGNKAEYSKEKYKYVAHIEGVGHILIDKHNRPILKSHFTTENPHKKGTVCYGAWCWKKGEFIENDRFEEIVGEADKVILNHHYKDKKGSCIIVCNGNKDVLMFQIEVGTDDQAKFDDPNNKEWIDLRK